MAPNGPDRETEIEVREFIRECSVTPNFSGDVILKKVTARITTREVAELLGIDLTTLRRLMRKGTITAPPIIFDPRTNSTGRMWSEDDVSGHVPP